MTEPEFCPFEVYHQLCTEEVIKEGKKRLASIPKIEEKKYK